jgi:hypothetical protein
MFVVEMADAVNSVWDMYELTNTRVGLCGRRVVALILISLPNRNCWSEKISLICQKGNISPHLCL